MKIPSTLFPLSHPKKIKTGFNFPPLLKKLETPPNLIRKQNLQPPLTSHQGGDVLPDAEGGGCCGRGGI
jgi:hypothetical protein